MVRVHHRLLPSTLEEARMPPIDMSDYFDDSCPEKGLYCAILSTYIPDIRKLANEASRFKNGKLSKNDKAIYNFKNRMELKFEQLVNDMKSEHTKDICELAGLPYGIFMRKVKEFSHQILDPNLFPLDIL